MVNNLCKNCNNKYLMEESNAEELNYFCSLNCENTYLKLIQDSIKEEMEW